jgi:isocitrate dehydrogenase
MTAKKKPATKKTKKPAAEPASKKATVSKKTTATKPKPVSRAKSPKSTADKKKLKKGKDGEMKVREIISKNSNKIASEPSSKKESKGFLFRRCKKYFIKKEKRIEERTVKK